MNADTDKRLDSLTREVRTLRLGVVLLVLFVAAAMTMGQAPQRDLQDADFLSVRTRMLTLVDETGALRALMHTTSAGGASLNLFSDSELAVALSSPGKGEELGSYLALFDERGKDRASFALSGDGSPSLELRDSNGLPRAVVGCNAYENRVTGADIWRRESSITLFNDEGRLTFSAP